MTNLTSECQISECPICYDTLGSGLRPIHCGNCETVICHRCQFNYGKDHCIKCNIKFGHDFILSNLGEKFIKEIVRPNRIAELMRGQRELLPSTQNEIIRLNELKVQRHNLRYGIETGSGAGDGVDTMHQSGEEAADGSGGSHEIFGCPKRECRGFIRRGYTCELCYTKVCSRCREVVVDGSDSTHVCKSENITLMEVLDSETKSCPRCTVKIYKIEGCNDMFCTHCHTHFCWRTGKVLKRSTNEHYLHLARYAENINTLDPTGGGSGSGNGDGCRSLGFDLDEYDNRRSIATRSRRDNLERALFVDSNDIKTLFRERYQKSMISSRSNEQLKTLRVKYLTGEIDEKAWGNKVYTINNRLQLNLIYSDILSLYLSAIDFLKHSQNDDATLSEELTRLIELCNSSFLSAQREYGGSTVQIKRLNDPPMSPAFQIVNK